MERGCGTKEKIHAKKDPTKVSRRALYKANLNFNSGYKPKIGKRYRLKFTISGYSGTGDIRPLIWDGDGNYANWTIRTANGTYIETVTIDGSLNSNQYDIDNMIY